MEESKILSCAWMWSEGSGDKYVFPKEALLDFAKELLSISQQADPTDTFTAVDMATAAAQGFRDGQAAVEQAAARDDREAPAVVATAILGGLYQGGSGPELGEIDIEVCMPALEALQCEMVNSYDDVFLPLMPVVQHESIVASLTRSAQKADEISKYEQQPLLPTASDLEELGIDANS